MDALVAPADRVNLTDPGPCSRIKFFGSRCSWHVEYTHIESRVEVQRVIFIKPAEFRAVPLARIGGCIYF